MITETTRWRKTRDFEFQDWINGELIDVLPQLANKKYLTDFQIVIELLPAVPLDGYFTLRWTLDGQFVENQLTNFIQTLPNSQGTDAHVIVIKMSDLKDAVVINQDGTYALNFGMTLVPNDITQGVGKVRLKCQATYESFYEN
jgi:hypothetical protein